MKFNYDFLIDRFSFHSRFIFYSNRGITIAGKSLCSGLLDSKQGGIFIGKFIRSYTKDNPSDKLG